MVPLAPVATSLRQELEGRLAEYRARRMVADMADAEAFAGANSKELAAVR
jgi:hypothetical protein